MRAWQQEVAAQVAGISLPLLTLSAASLGTQLSLSSENLPFGTVVLGSQVMHREQVNSLSMSGCHHTHCQTVHLEA